jgi:putative peptide zinc metalloprotease protein
MSQLSILEATDRKLSPNNPREYFVIPLSVQNEGDEYLVGNADFGDFYRFPAEGLLILRMLESGCAVADLKEAIAGQSSEPVDVDDFIDQLKSIEFIYPVDQSDRYAKRIDLVNRDKKVVVISRRLAATIFSLPTLIAYIGIVGYAGVSAYIDPSLRMNLSAFYINNNRTALFLLTIALYLVHVVFHELGHMTAAAKRGVRSKYGIGNRLWTIVAESDVTGLMTLPKAQRYLPLFAGILVDILDISLLTLLIKLLESDHVHAFAIQLIQALILQIAISITWQFNVFVKTDIYYVLCNYFSHPDLDKDARIYLGHLLYVVSFGRFGKAGYGQVYQSIGVLRIFSVIWIAGRIFSVILLLGVFLPTIVRYILSAVRLFNQPGSSVWAAIDISAFASLSLATTGIGLYMWFSEKRRKPAG